MSSKTKIVVLHMKEVIYTMIFIVLAIVLIGLLIFMFGPGKKNRQAEETAVYNPGVYTASIQLGGQTLDVQVAVDEDHINGVSLVNLDETVATMYPLLQSSMDSISQQICEDQSLGTHFLLGGESIHSHDPCRCGGAGAGKGGDCRRRGNRLSEAAGRKTGQQPEKSERK